MGIALRATNDHLVVDPGATVPLAVTIENRGQESDEFELQVEGLDPDWIMVPVAAWRLGPGESREERVFLKPPRVSESRAGVYPVVVRVRSLTTGESESVQAMVEVRPFHHLSVDVAPRRASLPVTGRPPSYRVTVMNLGNSPHTVQLFAGDPDEMTVCEFGEERLEVGPGQQREVEMTVSAKRRLLLANPRLYGLSVTARSTNLPTVVASAQAQLEQRPLLTPGLFAFLVFVLVLVTGWIVLYPKPPAVTEFVAEPEEVLIGQAVQLQWRARDADYVLLKAGERRYDRLKPVGTQTILPATEGPLEVEIVAVRGQSRSEPVRKTIVARKPPEIPPARIEAFDIQPRAIRLGERLTVTYRISGPPGTRAVLSPPGQDLNLNIEQIEIEPSRPGTVRYQLVVDNGAGVMTEKAIEVRVVEASLAEIVSFVVEPTTLPPGGGTVRISWQLRNARRAVLRVGAREQDVDSIRGSVEETLSQTTAFELIAYDEVGRPASKTIKATVEPPVSPSGPLDEGSAGGTEPPASGGRL